MNPHREEARPALDNGPDDYVAGFFDDSSLAGTRQPKCVILMGPVASGKTTLRKEVFNEGYVIVDAAEIFNRLSGDAILDFSSALEEPMEQIGQAVAQRAIAERRHIVTEIIGAELPPIQALIKALHQCGYEVHGTMVDCDPMDSLERNAQRAPECISAHFAEEFQLRWLTSAARAWAGAHKN